MSCKKDAGKKSEAFDRTDKQEEIYIMNILITIPDNPFRKLIFKENIIKKFEALGTVIWNEGTQPFSNEELKERLKTADACITSWGKNKITYEMIKGSPLKFIGHIGGGVHGLVEREIFDTNIKIVSGNPAFARTLAEYALMLLLMAARKAYDRIYALRTHPEVKDMWGQNTLVDGINGKRIGILGLGEVSKRLIRMLKGFDVDIWVCDDYCTKEQEKELGFMLVSLEQLVAGCDAITIHHTLTEKTLGLLDADMIKKMRAGAILVNTARGEIVDEDALILELQTGRISAALDVYRKEPLPPEHPFLRMSNVIALPHMGGKTYECREEMLRIILEDLKRLINKEDLLYAITKEQYDRMSRKIAY